MWSPACTVPSTARVIAAMPDPVARAASPPSSAATFSWNWFWVGLRERP